MRNRGAVGAKGVDSGHGEILEFFAYKHVGNCWGNCKRRRREAAIAKGKKLLPTRGSEERRKLPQLGMGRSPRIRRNFEHFMPKWSAFWDAVNLIFFKNQSEKIIDERSCC